MRAILLAAGYGTRLRPITNNIPKCLVPINGRPLLDIWLNNLNNAEIKPILLNTHYLADKVEAYLRQSEYAEIVQVVHEHNLLGTAGTLKLNADFYGDEDGLLIHADNYCNIDFTELIKAHYLRPYGCEMTMVTFRTPNPSMCGIVEVNEEGIVLTYHEKVEYPPGNLANGAIYILSNRLIKDIKSWPENVNDFSTQVLPELTGKIYTYEAVGLYLDIGTPEAYELANHVASNI